MEPDEKDSWVESFRRVNCSEFGAKLDQYKEEKKYTDVTIVCRDDRVFACHSLILAAISEYFERIFLNGDSEGDVENDPVRRIVLSYTDAAEFEYVMRCAYKDEVLVNDDNVLTLLRLSQAFEVAILENWCICYLTERHVPTEHALELFAFACATRNTVLTPLVARFILYHLREFEPGANGLLQISRDNMKTLLAYWRSSSRKRTNELLDILSHWMSHSMSQQADREAFLTEILPTFQAGHVLPDSVEQRLRENRHITIQSSAREPLFVHVYVEKSYLTRQLLSFTKNAEGDGLTLRSSPQKIKFPSKIKNVAVDDRLYSYVFHKGSLHNESRFTFSVSTSAGLHDRKTLKLPEEFFPRAFGRMFQDRDFDTLSSCSDPIGQRIYLSHYFDDAQSTQPNLFEYDCETGRWYPVYSDGNDLKYVDLITHSNSRLYAIGSPDIVRAFDSRSGKWDTLPSTKSVHYTSDASCCHKEKIYLTCNRISKDRQQALEVYDPVAGRWSVITPSPTSISKPIDDVAWLASYDDELWIFGMHSRASEETEYRYNYRKYDSFSQRWNDTSSLPISSGRGFIIDVAVFK